MNKNPFFLKGLLIGIGIGIILPLIKSYIERGVFDVIGFIIALFCISLGFVSQELRIKEK